VSDLSVSSDSVTADLPSMTLDTGLSIWKNRWTIRRPTLKLPTSSGAKAEPKVIQRWSATRKREIVLRLLRGEALDVVSREIGVEVYRLERWRDKALAAMDAGLKERTDDDPVQAGLDAAHKRVGELRLDNGPQDTSHPFSHQIDHWGMALSYAFPHQPEGNGVIERFFRTLKEPAIWGRTLRTAAEVRAAVTDFAARYNAAWRLERLGFLSPLDYRARHLYQESLAA